MKTFYQRFVKKSFGRSFAIVRRSSEFFASAGSRPAEAVSVYNEPTYSRTSRSVGNGNAAA